eukprot:jgi/Hompol1/3108/HPOL_006343-RA
MSPGITLVISPLIALIQNQVDALVKLKINAATLNSSMKVSEKNKVAKDLASGKPKLKLLYVTPELLATPAFRATMAKIFKAGMFSRLVIDEVVSITVRDDIIKQLHLDPANVAVFAASFDRENLHYEVRFKPAESNSPLDDVLRFLSKVYESRRKRIEQTNVNERTDGICGIM